MTKDLLTIGCGSGSACARCWSCRCSSWWGWSWLLIAGLCHGCRWTRTRWRLRRSNIGINLRHVDHLSVLRRLLLRVQVRLLQGDSTPRSRRWPRWWIHWLRVIMMAHMRLLRTVRRWRLLLRLVWLRGLSHGLSNSGLLLRCARTRLWLRDTLRFHSDIHCQMLQSLLQCIDIIVRFKRRCGTIERLFETFGHLGKLCQPFLRGIWLSLTKKMDTTHQNGEGFQ